MTLAAQDYFKLDETSEIYFAQRDLKKIKRMTGQVNVVSTVCPDYPNNGQAYTFNGPLGTGISLTSWVHLKTIPGLLDYLDSLGLSVNWIILVADLPELTAKQKEFYCRVAESKEEYIRRCALSVLAIQEEIQETGQVMSFSQFYELHEIPYLEIQQQTATNVLDLAVTDKNFGIKFNSFMLERRQLAQHFRGRKLDEEELADAAAHGMSLYITHGTLLRRIFLKENLIVINHDTPNLKNFFLAQFVPDHQHIVNTERFPIGIVSGDFY